MNWGMSVTGMSSVRQTLETLQTTWSGDTLYIAGPTVEYAVFQEKGTRHIDARPFMRPAAEAVGANPSAMLDQYGQEPVENEAIAVKTIALAVQEEAKRIANQKGVRDSGQLISSISVERVQ